MPLSVLSFALHLLVTTQCGMEGKITWKVRLDDLRQCVEELQIRSRCRDIYTSN